jgi:PhnB protein
MARGSLSAQLDSLVDSILARSAAPVSSADERIAALGTVAAGLRGLPRPDFKQRLKNDLMRRTSMTTVQEKPTASYKRGGFRTVTPYLIAQRGEELIDFVKQAFGAEELFRAIGSAGGYHCEVRLGDSMLMLGGGAKYKGPSSPTAIHLKVDNVDEAYRRCLALGATSLYEPADFVYGEHGAGVRDAFGNYWYLAKPQGDTHFLPEMGTVTVCFQPKGADRFIDFLTQAFGAEEMARHAVEGTIRHSKVRVGDSILELAEAHGPYQPMESTLFMYVENIGETYERALAAGATSLYPPAVQPYGGRGAGVRDAFGHTWYLATHTEK